MKLSTRSTYGMRALVELALTAGHGPVSATLIAKRQGLSVAYLEQLLHRLKRQGMIRSVRGPRGGYLLAMEPQRITMADVVHILDGNGAGNGTDRRAARRAASNGRSDRQRAPTLPHRQRLGRRGRSRDDRNLNHRHAQRIAQAVWRCVHERITASLDAVTLRDLCAEVGTDAGEPLEHRYVFHI